MPFNNVHYSHSHLLDFFYNVKKALQLTFEGGKNAVIKEYRTEFSKETSDPDPH